MGDIPSIALSATHYTYILSHLHVAHPVRAWLVLWLPGSVLIWVNEWGAYSKLKWTIICCSWLCDPTFQLKTYIVFNNEGIGNCIQVIIIIAIPSSFMSFKNWLLLAAEPGFGQGERF